MRRRWVPREARKWTRTARGGRTGRRTDMGWTAGRMHRGHGPVGPRRWFRRNTGTPGRDPRHPGRRQHGRPAEWAAAGAGARRAPGEGEGGQGAGRAGHPGLRAPQHRRADLAAGRRPAGARRPVHGGRGGAGRRGPPLGPAHLVHHLRPRQAVHRLRHPRGPLRRRHRDDRLPGLQHGHREQGRRRTRGPRERPAPGGDPPALVRQEPAGLPARAVLEAGHQGHRRPGPARRGGRQGRLRAPGQVVLLHHRAQPDLLGRRGGAHHGGAARRPAARHRPDHRGRPRHPHLQREDGGDGHAGGDPDERSDGRLRRRVRHPRRPARHAAHRLRHLPARQLLGPDRARRVQRQPRLRRSQGRPGRQLGHARRVVLRPQPDR
ncbi:hypothetical protein SGPA1_11649 [Streptomyces misionensis JCM 4497]